MVLFGMPAGNNVITFLRITSFFSPRRFAQIVTVSNSISPEADRSEKFLGTALNPKSRI
jgi:hypothetical protein